MEITAIFQALCLMLLILLAFVVWIAVDQCSYIDAIKRSNDRAQAEIRALEARLLEVNHGD